jgi:hypothetical protein
MTEHTWALRNEWQAARLTVSRSSSHMVARAWVGAVHVRYGRGASPVRTDGATRLSAKR